MSKSKDLSLESFAPAQFFKMKVRDNQTGESHMFLLFDAGDIEDSKGKRAPLPLIVLNEKTMREQQAFPPSSSVLADVQREILKYRALAPTVAKTVELPSVDVMGGT